MKILITGATSGLGRNAVDFLKQQDISFTATGRNLQAGKLLQEQGIEFIPCDLSQAKDEELIELLANVTAVWHCAALSSPWGDYQAFYQANVVATERLADFAVKQGVARFIHISTPSIYFDFQHHQDIHESYRAKHFANYYAKTKWLAEQKIRELAENFPHTQFVILRPRAIFGAYDRVLLPRIMELIKQRKGVLPLPNGGKVKMDVTYALNVVQAMWLATINDIQNTENVPTYNITNQEPITLAMLLDKLFRQKLEQDFRIKPLPYPFVFFVAKGLEWMAKLTKKEPKLTAYSAGTLYFDMVLNNEKAQRELGYIPRYSLDEAIEQTAYWLKNGEIK